MPGTTPLFGLRYPLSSEAPDGPAQLLALATDVENTLNAEVPQGASPTLDGIVAGTGWSIGTHVAAKVGPLAIVHGTVTRTGASTAAGDTGTPAHLVLTMPTGWRPVAGTAAVVGNHSGGVGIGRLHNSGEMAIRYWSLGIASGSAMVWGAAFLWA